ncbi:MAG: hypothetical protein H0W89_06910, partial [Candidatus Levybacteria bacterium]|nr:hypothetical protein [Candidatus Levybacteria bacterium]
MAAEMNKSSDATRPKDTIQAPSGKTLDTDSRPKGLPVVSKAHPLAPGTTGEFTQLAGMRDRAYSDASVLGAISVTATERGAQKLDTSGSFEAIDTNLEVLERVDAEKDFGKAATVLAGFAGKVDNRLIAGASMYPDAQAEVASRNSKIDRLKDLVGKNPAFAAAMPSDEIVAATANDHRILEDLPTRLPRLAEALSKGP